MALIHSRARSLPLALLLVAVPTFAQTQYTLDPTGNWVAKSAPAPADPDAAIIASARQLLADNKPSEAKSILEKWVEEHETSQSPLLPQAYLLKGDATTADGNEFNALYDYESVCLQYPGSEEFVKALQRELDIAIQYLHGLKRKWLGMRLTDSENIGEELLVRVQERLPGSALAEKACLELANYYYRTRDLKLAADAYEIFAKNFPRSEHASEARELRIYSNIGRFQGPNYDASGLVDAQILIEEYAKDDPVGARAKGLSDALVARLDESTAVQLLEKARWYFKRGDPVSARYVLRRLVATHPQTVAAGTALKIMQERGWPAAEPTSLPSLPAASSSTPDPNQPTPAPAPTSQPAPETPR